MTSDKYHISQRGSEAFIFRNGHSMTQQAQQGRGQVSSIGSCIQRGSGKAQAWQKTKRRIEILGKVIPSYTLFIYSTQGSASSLFWPSVTNTAIRSRVQFKRQPRQSNDIRGNPRMVNIVLLRTSSNRLLPGSKSASPTRPPVLPSQYTTSFFFPFVVPLPFSTPREHIRSAAQLYNRESHEPVKPSGNRLKTGRA